MAVPDGESAKVAPNYANVAANLANSNRKAAIAPETHFHGHGRSKSTSTPSTQPLNGNLGVAGSKAAISAHSRRPRSQDGPNSARPPPKRQTLQSKAAEAALNHDNDGGKSAVSRHDQPNHNLEDKAAAAALKSWHKTPASAPATNRSIYGDRRETASPAVAKAWLASTSTSTNPTPTNRVVYGERGEKASPAVTAAWGAQKQSSHRSLVTPLSPREQAMIEAKINARKQESSERHTRQPIIKIGAEYLGEHPPVRLEREEKAHAADLHEQAVTLAKQAYARQQANASNHNSVGSQAQQLASVKIAKLNKTDNELEKMRDYYGTPAPPQRSKSQILRGRSKSGAAQTAEAEDLAQSQRIKSQMNTLRSQIDQVDASKQEQDRKRLLEAARRKVQGDMLKMDEHVYKDTGKMSRAMMEEWEAKARERQRESRSQTSFQHMEHDKAVNIGGGKVVDQGDIDQLAISRVKPTLAGIDEAVQRRRELDQQKIDEKEEHRLEKEKEKEEKAEAKRVKAAEKQKIREQKAAEKAVEHPEGEEKKSALRIPVLTKFSRHRRTESTEHVSEDETSSIEEKEDKRRRSIFGKFGRGRHNETEDQPAVVAGNTEARETKDGVVPATTRSRSKSLKSRFTKLVARPQTSDAVERDQFSDAVENQPQEASFVPPTRPRSDSTDLEDDSSIISPVEELAEPVVEASKTGWKPTETGEASGIKLENTKRESGVSAYEEEWHNADEVRKSSISVPQPIAGSMSSEGRTSADDRDDKLFGKHLPSKFHENM